MLLGKNTEYKSTYAPEVLFRINRQEDRALIGEQKWLDGLDVWHNYECSFLLPNNEPVVGVGKMVYSANTPFMVESKSLKLYFFSLNNHYFETVEDYEQTVVRDVSKCVGGEVEFKLHTTVKNKQPNTVKFEKLIPDCTRTDKPLHPHFTLTEIEKPEVLVFIQVPSKVNIWTDVLRSNCKVTNQPDWADVYVSRQSGDAISNNSLLQYFISYRNANHFHEEVVERVFNHLLTPTTTNLCVTGLFTRRGGIDINPIRWLGEKTTKIDDVNTLYMKTLRG